jgi:hypothetical protein
MYGIRGTGCKNSPDELLSKELPTQAMTVKLRRELSIGLANPT